jgi:nitrite reductase/ring-hydroxylating ferredoxin subunit
MSGDLAAEDGGQAADRWFPVARSEEAPPRHVVQAQLLGQEIALWRDDSGALNAWENRCPHRGVRLSIGINDGTTLRCQYHGWRYASGNGQCVLIPAHPEQKPSNVIRAKPYGVAEAYGFIWVNLSGGATDLPALGLNGWTTLRSVFVAAPIAAVEQGLKAQAEGPVVLLQPVTETETIIHGLLPEALAGDERLALLRSHNARLTELRDSIEAAGQRSAA